MRLYVMIESHGLGFIMECVVGKDICEEYNQTLAADICIPFQYKQEMYLKRQSAEFVKDIWIYF